jgi:hypothetical protein
MPNTELATTEIIEIDPPKPPNQLKEELQQAPEKAPERQDKRFLCDGRRCGSPALRDQNFCFYHAVHRTHMTPAMRRRQLKSGFELTCLDGLDNPSAIQLALCQVLHRLAENSIEPKRAGLLIYGLQVAGTNLRRTHTDANSRVPEAIVEDDVFGQLAVPEPGRTVPENYFQRMARQVRNGEVPSYEDF